MKRLRKFESNQIEKSRETKKLCLISIWGWEILRSNAPYKKEKSENKSKSRNIKIFGKKIVKILLKLQLWNITD